MKKFWFVSITLTDAYIAWTFEQNKTELINKHGKKKK